MSEMMTIQERTHGEKLAYVQGYEAAIKLIGWRLALGVEPEKAVGQARAALELARGTV